MSLRTARRVLAGPSMAVLLAGGILAGSWTAALAAAPQTPGASVENVSPSPAPDPYQRSLKIYQYKKAAARGPARGEEIFYYKCFFCHNDYTKATPRLQGLFTRAALMSGQPVTDDTVKDKIRNGGQAMPDFRYTLGEADLSDLVSFLHRCCFNPDSPPPNPDYRVK